MVSAVRSVSANQNAKTRDIPLDGGRVEALSRGWGEQDRTIASTLQEERAEVEFRLGKA